MEHELIAKAKEGDRAAFNELVKGCAESIYNLALRLCANRADAEDFAQDAFVSAFKHIGRFEERSSFSSWVYRITVNLWKNKVKYEKRRFFFWHVSLDKVLETEDDEVPRQLASGEDDPLTSVERQDEAGKIQAALKKLDDEERAIIVLCDMEEKSYEEIAQLLNCKLGTVKSRIARARESLRKEWVRTHEMQTL